ncbi:MAG: N-acetylmuramoyl-L-alanine amidase [Anaerolineales bacterium]
MAERFEHPFQPTRPPASRQVMRNLAVALTVAAALATVFTAWTPASLSPGELAGQLAAAVDRAGDPTQPAAAVVPDEAASLRIGIVAGHSGVDATSGISDPGAVCDDGLTERDVNMKIAQLVVRGLEAAGFSPDMLEEFDDRLVGYRAVALVSIHADSCEPINDQATGYKISAALDTAVPDRAQRLISCIADRYGSATGLIYHPDSITRDMTGYHTFYEVNSQTPAVIIETGFLYLDRTFLTQEPEKAARGIVEGLLCYVNNEPINPIGAGAGE